MNDSSQSELVSCIFCDAPSTVSSAHIHKIYNPKTGSYSNIEIVLAHQECKECGAWFVTPEQSKENKNNLKCIYQENANNL